MIYTLKGGRLILNELCLTGDVSVLNETADGYSEQLPLPVRLMTSQSQRRRHLAEHLKRVVLSMPSNG